MKQIGLSLLLVFFQIALPIPWQAATKTSQDNSARHNNGTTGKAPDAQSTSLQNVSKAEVPKKDTQSTAAEHEEKTVSVRVPPINVHKDWADYLYIIAGLLLTLATLAIAIYAAIQAKAAKRSADAYELTVRLTERADVLLESAGIIMSKTTQLFDGHARVVLRFNNFGRTRARDVQIRARLIIPEVPDGHGVELPSMVLGASQGQSVSFEPFIDFLNKPTFDGIARGDIEMRFESWLVYIDVFDAAHTTRDVGIFDSSNMTFRVAEHTAG